MNLLPAFTGTPEPGNVYHMDALELLKALPDASVDAVITDPPYGFEKTKTTWDKCGVPFDVEVFMNECLRVNKKQGAICIFGAPPFSSFVITSALNIYRYSWYYEKPRGANFGNSRHQPLRVIEEIMVFSESIASPNQFTNGDDVMHYHPPLVKLKRPYIREDKPTHQRIASPSLSTNLHNPTHGVRTYNYATPTNLFYAAMDSDSARGLHPTQKPIEVCKYLVETYTQPGDLILDPFAGSGTTLLAARNLNRRFIGGDITLEYVDMARKRLAQPYTLNMFETVAVAGD